MTRRLVVCHAVLAATLVATAVHGRAQNILLSGDFPLRSTMPPPRGTGLVVGRVVDGESRRPVAGATIYTALSGSQTADYEPVLTDDQGRFVLRDLPKGNFSIRAWRSGYVDGAYARATPMIGGAGELFTLADDERVGDVVIKMWKFAAVGGVVTDEANEPMVGITVRALTRRVVNGRRVLSLDQMQGYTDVTDDRGMYRISGLPPGEYVVAVPVTSASWPKSLARLTASGPTARGADMPTYTSSRWLSGGSGGGVGSLIDVGDEAFAFAHRELSGRGSGAGPTIAGVRADGTLLMYETQFYPGATSLARASLMKLGSGAEQSGVDFRMQPVPASRVSGVVLGPDGPARDLVVRLVHAETSQMSADPETAMTATDEAGRFTFLGIPPGQYVARILKTPRPAASGASELTQAVRTGSGVGGITVIGASSSLPGLPTDPTWWAETPVSVGERPVEGVSLTLREGLRISGRVRFVGNSTPPPMNRLGSVTIERADGSSANTVATSSRFGRIDVQGNLSTYGQVPGHYLVRMSSAVPGWYFAGAMLGGRDVSVTPLELTDAHVEGVVLTFTDTPLAEISGTVTLDRAGADEDATVVVFPANPNLWANTYDGSRNLRSVAVTRGSRYAVGNLPPGEYFVAGVAGPPPPLEVATLERLAKSAARVKIADSEKKIVDVRVPAAKAPDAEMDDEAGQGPFVPDDQPQTPQRDARPAVPAGTGVIAGVILTAEATPKPLRRANVALAGAALLGGRTVITDDTGRFAFTQVPAGRFTLQASKAAFIYQAYGATRPGGAGTTILLADGQRMTDITLKLARGGVITGRIRDERGQPASGIQVQAARMQNTATGPRRLVSNTATTDDRGEYRIYGLNAAEYVVEASPRMFSGSNARPTIQEDLDFAAAALRGRASGAAATTPAVPARRPAVALATVFYPGTTMLDSAQKVVVSLGEERAGIDMALQVVPTVSLDGAVSNPAGPLPSNLEVRLTAISGVGVSSDLFSMLPVRPGPDGRFSFSGVAPGLYVVSAVTGAAGRGASADATSLWATSDVQVQGVDVQGVALSLQPGMTVSGRVSFDGTTAKPPADLTTVRVSLQPVLTGSQISIGQLSSPVNADGTFVAHGVMPGRYRISSLVSAAGGAPGWTARSAMTAGFDALDLPFDVHGGRNVVGVEVTFTDRTIELTGMLTDASGKPAPEYFLIAFPADRNLWAAPRRVAQARPGTDGRFTIRTLRPGQYLLAAVTDLEPGMSTDPELLESLMGSAITITLVEGDKKVQDVRIGGN